MENKRFTSLALVLFNFINSAFCASNTTTQLKFAPLTMLQEFVDFSKLEVIDLIRSSAVIIAFCAVVFGDNGGQAFRRASGAGMLMFGCVSFFFPQEFISYMISSKLDIGHQFVTTSIGIGLLAIVGTMWYVGEPSEQAKGAGILVRFLILLSSLMIHIVARSTGKINFTPQHSSFILLALGLLTLTYMINIYRHGDFGRQTVQVSLNSGINRHLMVDVIMMCTVAVFDLAFTEMGFSYYFSSQIKIDSVHIFLGKIFALQEMAMFLMALMALGFADDRDKKMIFIHRIIMCTLSVPCLIMYHLKHSLFNPSATAMIVFSMGVIMLNSTWAMWGNPIHALSAVASPQVERALRRRKDH